MLPSCDAYTHAHTHSRSMTRTVTFRIMHFKLIYTNFKLLLPLHVMCFDLIWLTPSELWHVKSSSPIIPQVPLRRTLLQD